MPTERKVMVRFAADCRPASEALERLAARLPESAAEVVDATVPRIEAVYFRYGGVEAYEADSVEDATSFLESGEDHGELSSVGVFVDGEPSLYAVLQDPAPPTDVQAAEMLGVYRRWNR